MGQLGGDKRHPKQLYVQSKSRYLVQKNRKRLYRLGKRLIRRIRIRKIMSDHQKKKYLTLRVILLILCKYINEFNEHFLI
jgi:hypothetical protein